MFEITQGNVFKRDEARRLKLSLVLDWLYLARQQKDVELELQAAMYGIKLKGVRQLKKVAGSGLVSFKKFGAKQVKVSEEELERRRAGK